MGNQSIKRNVRTCKSKKNKQYNVPNEKVQKDRQWST